MLLLTMRYLVPHSDLLGVTKECDLLYWPDLPICSSIINNIAVNSVILIRVLSKVISLEDEKLLGMLRRNARASISDLARALNVSRSTVQNRLHRLEQSGVVKGYVLEYGSAFLSQLVSAHVAIKVRQKLTTKTNVELKQISQISELYAISGEYDLIAVVQAQSTEQLSHILDEIGNLDGVERTNSSVILETKFKR